MKTLTLISIIFLSFSPFAEAGRASAGKGSPVKIQEDVKLKKILTKNGHPVRTKNGHFVYSRPK